MDPVDAHKMLAFLYREQESGVRVCAWNGLGFDLRWIGHNAGDMELAKQLGEKRRSLDAMLEEIARR